MKKGLVWFKKDLRVVDHLPLLKACTECNEVVGLYIYEPEWFVSYEFDPSHIVFLQASLDDLRIELIKLNVNLIVRFDSAKNVFQDLKQQYAYTHVYSHQETGVGWTFKRDIEIAEYLKSQSIQWEESLQFAVFRALKNRDQWNQMRVRTIQRKIFPSRRASQTVVLDQDFTVDHQVQELIKQNTKQIQKGGLKAAHETLQSFLDDRSKTYLQSISSPWLAKDFGSRLSPYLSFGNLSLTQVHHALLSAYTQHRDDFFWIKSLRAFESRLWWHCHFIQKLETEPEIEFFNVNRAFDGLRESDFSTTFFEAWCRGQTGFPMIDATMRCLHRTGWVNFRMRAMLVSFASYQLWLHWRKTGEYLARQFLDFEPGIHFSQLQMQSGVTGINTIRIYSPHKQALDQKGAAEFIRTYCPELQMIPDEYIHDPQTLPPLFQIELGFKMGEHYPFPIVDPKESYHRAKDKIFQFRKQIEVKSAARAVYKKHGSRAGGAGKRFFPTQRREQIFGNLKKTKE